MSTLDTCVDQLHKTIETIGMRYFVDPSEERVGEKTVPFWKIMLGVFTLLDDRNMWLVGNKGSGKTTFSSLLASVVHGLPFHLFDALKIQCHPEQTKDSMFVRIDLGRLAEEKVVLQPSVYLPVLVIDEFNMNPPGKQTIAREFSRTGLLEHFGNVFYKGKFSFIATVNHNGPGTYPVADATYDRFDIAIEFTPGTSSLQDEILGAKQKIEEELLGVELSVEISDFLHDKKVSVDEKLTRLKQYAKKQQQERAKLGILPAFDVQKMKLAVKEARKIPYTPDGQTYLNCVWEEINTTRKYGTNRRDDMRDTSAHNQAFASARVLEGMSVRAWDAIKFYAGMLAAYLKDDKVDVAHVQAVAPYCLAHRLEFTDDFLSTLNERQREHDEWKKQFAARELLRLIKTNYAGGTDKEPGVAHQLKLLDSFIAGAKLDREQMTAVEEILKGPEPDHPLFRTYWHSAQERVGGKHE